MVKFSFDREKRQEAARIKELRELLGQVEQGNFWGRMSKAQGSGAEERDSFQQAIVRRAKALGITPEKLLSNYAQALRESTYPTPECLEAEEVQAIVALRTPSIEQSRHLQSCPACQQLLEACQQSPAETKALMAIVREAAAGARQPWPEVGTTADTRGGVANELILVIQDNDKIRKVVRDVLTFKGYEIIEAGTGEEGIRLAQERRPSLVLMDIQLPGIDGIEALGQLRAKSATRGIPVMAMTASGMTADRRRITDAGFDAYQGKPIKVNDLIVAVERLLEHR